MQAVAGSGLAFGGRDRRYAIRMETSTHESAMVTARTSPQQHVPRHLTNQEVRARMAGTSTIGRFNSKVAVGITKAVGSMWAAYLFVLISLVSFPQALNAFLNGDTVTGVAWLSQSFLQLVLLPIIIVGQNVISASQDARAEADHITLTTLHAINVQQLKMLEQQQAMLKQQREILDLLQARGITMSTDEPGA